MSNAMLPEVVVVRDYDGYFEALVRKWIEGKAEAGGEFRHGRIAVEAGPWRLDAVTTREDGGTLWLDFYAALRVGFGQLTERDVELIKEKL